jgi:PQQ-dependent catabolism-associated CXXCW motif protein
MRKSAADPASSYPPSAIRYPLLLLLLLLSLPALSADVAEPEGYWTGPVNSDVPATITGGTVIHTHELAALLREGNAILIDVSNAPVRPAQMAPSSTWLPLPHDSIMGSHWLAGAGQGRIVPEVERLFASTLQQTTAGNFDRPVVIYCHERCWLSWNASRRAIRLGYRRIYWFPEGIEGWRAAGFKTAVTQPEAGETSSPPASR